MRTKYIALKILTAIVVVFTFTFFAVWVILSSVQPGWEKVNKNDTVRSDYRLAGCYRTATAEDTFLMNKYNPGMVHIGDIIIEHVKKDTVHIFLTWDYYIKNRDDPLNKGCQNKTETNYFGAHHYSPKDIK